MTDNIQSLLPDRNHTDIPEQVQFILSVCETAVIWHDYQERHMDEPQECFCRGVVDYWWEDDMEEPRWDQVFRKTIDGEIIGARSHKYFCYQRGAILGHKMRKEYRE